MTDNPNAFKHQINPKTAGRLAAALKRAWPPFDARGFLREVKEGLKPLELKQRVAFVGDAMARRLPPEYPKALPLVLKTLGPELNGTLGTGQDLFYHWIHGHFVETRGLDYFDQSLQAMVEITKRSTAEFAVRPYLAKDPGRVLAFLEKQVTHPNPHVRRWISEGTRPLLPWGRRLAAFIRDPRPALRLLERLRKDPSRYVQNSVANHLNDIAKHHPDLAVKTVSAWLREGFPAASWIARRALRHLIKQGHPAALKALGFQAGTRTTLKDLLLDKKRVRVGEKLSFSFVLVGRARERLAVDYAIRYRSANGRTGRKVYKLTTREIKAGDAVPIRKTHSFRPVTTRVYYPGAHAVEILVNGRTLGTAAFALRL